MMLFAIHVAESTVASAPKSVERRRGKRAGEACTLREIYSSLFMNTLDANGDEAPSSAVSCRRSAPSTASNTDITLNSASCGPTEVRSCGMAATMHD